LKSPVYVLSLSIKPYDGFVRFLLLDHGSHPGMKKPVVAQSNENQSKQPGEVDQFGPGNLDPFLPETIYNQIILD